MFLAKLGAAADSSAWYPYDAASWGGLCESGVKQSPIDLPKYTGFKRNVLDLNWGNPVELTASKAHSMKWAPKETTNTLTWPPADAGFVRQDFKLLQLHCHTGSENVVNGKQYAGECHFVHMSDGDDLLVVGLFLDTDGDQESEALAQLLDPLGDGLENTGEEDLAAFVFSSLVEKADLKQYWTFSGSLTTPPCTEGLQWIVLATPLKVSEAQIEQMVEKSGWDNNFRPPQPLYGRRVGPNAANEGWSGSDFAVVFLAATLILTLAGFVFLYKCGGKKSPVVSSQNIPQKNVPSDRIQMLPPRTQAAHPAMAASPVFQPGNPGGYAPPGQATAPRGF